MSEQHVGRAVVDIEAELDTRSVRQSAGELNAALGDVTASIDAELVPSSVRSAMLDLESQLNMADAAVEIGAEPDDAAIQRSVQELRAAIAGEDLEASVSTRLNSRNLRRAFDQVEKDARDSALGITRYFNNTFQTLEGQVRTAAGRMGNQLSQVDLSVDAGVDFDEAEVSSELARLQAMFEALGFEIEAEVDRSSLDDALAEVQRILLTSDLDATIRASFESAEIPAQVEALQRALGTIEVPLEPELDITEVAAQARAAARAAQQRVEIEMVLDARGIRRDLDGLFRDTNGDVVELSGLLDTLTDAFSDVGSAITDVGSTITDVGSGSRGLSRSLTRISGQAASMGSSLAVVGVAAAALAPLMISLSGAVAAIGLSVLQASGSLIPFAAQLGAVGLAFGTVKVGSQGVSEALALQSRAQEELAQTGEVSESTMQSLKAAMDDLAPSARSFVTAIQGLRGEWGEFTEAIQQPLFAGLGRDITNTAQNLLPALSAALRPVAADINDAAQSFLRWAGSDATIQRISETIAGLRPILQDLMDAAGSFGDGLLTLFTGSLPQAQQLSDSISDIGQSFEDWAARITESGEFADFLDRASDSAGTLLDIFGNLGSVIGSAFKTGSDSGDDMLSSLERITQEWADFLATEEGQQEIKDFFTDVRDTVSELGPLMAGLGDAIQAFRDLIDPMNTVLDVMGKISDLSPNVYELVDALEDLFSGDFDAGARGLLDGVGDIAQFTTGAGLILSAFQMLPEQVSGALSTLGSNVVGFFTGLPGRITGALSNLGTLLQEDGFNLLQGLLTGIFNGWITVVTFFITLPFRILGLLVNLGPLLVDTGARLIGGLFRGIMQGWISVVTFFITLPFRILGLVANLGPQLVRVGIRLMRGFLRGIMTGWISVVTFFVTLPFRILAFVANFGTLLRDAGVKLLTGLRTGASNRWNNNVRPFFANLGPNISSAVGNLGRTLWAAGGEVLRGLGEGAVVASVAVMLWFGRLPEMITSAIGDAFGWAVDIGVAIIDGIISGVSGAAGRLADAVRSAASDAFNAATNFLDSNSPSRLFRDEVGAQLMAGWILGVERNARALEQAVRNAARPLPGAAQITMPTTTNVPRRGAPVPAYAGSGGVATQQQAAGVQVTQNFYGPTTSGGRLKELDWTIRFSSKARSERVAGVAR